MLDGAMAQHRSPHVFATEPPLPPNTPTRRLWSAVLMLLIRDAASPCRCPLLCRRRQAIADSDRRDLRALLAPLGLEGVLRTVAALPVCGRDAATARPERLAVRSAA